MRFMEWAAYAVLCLALCLGIASFSIGIYANGKMYTEPPDYTTDRTDEYLAIKYEQMAESFFRFAVVAGVVGLGMMVGAGIPGRRRKERPPVEPAQ